MKSFADYGAIGDGITDDTFAVQSAINSNTSLCLGGGSSGIGQFLLTSTIKISNSLCMVGDGWKNSFLVSSPFAYSTLFNISPNTQSNHYYFNNFGVITNSNDVGPIAINLITALPTQYLSQPKFTNLLLNLNNEVTIASENNNSDGLACLLVDHCTLSGGIFLNNAGDSIIISNNIITGGGIGIFGSFVAGAGCLNIESNNITSTGGALYLSGATACYITNNEIENVVYGYNGTVDATVFIENSEMVTLFGNSINAGSVCSAVRLQNCYKPLLNRSRINVSSPKYHVWQSGCTYQSYFGNQYIVTPIGNVTPGWGTEDGLTMFNPPFLTSD